MFTNDIVSNGDAGSSVTYALTSIAGGKSVRSVSGLPLGNNRSMTISHASAGKPGEEVDRHMERFDFTTVDTAGKSATASVYAVLVVPRTVVTVAQVQDLVTQLKNFLSSANVAKLLNNEP